VANPKTVAEITAAPVESTHRFHVWHDLGWHIVTITGRKLAGDNSPHFRTRMRLHVSISNKLKGYITKTISKLIHCTYSCS
jgi:hypothetical protein